MLFCSWNYKMRLSPVMRLKRVIMLFTVFAVSEYCQYRKKRSDTVYFLRERYIEPCSSVRTWLFSFSRYKNFCPYCLRIVKLTAKPYHERNILFVTPILAPAYPWTATFFRNRMLSLFRYLRQLTLYRHRNVTSVCVCFCFSAWFERRFFPCCFALPVVRISTNLKTLTWLLRCQSKFI